MPLDREHITRASRVMLPVYVAAFTLLGVNYLATPRDNLRASPTLHYVDRLIILPVWGALFMVAGLMMLAALMRAKRTWFRLALNICWISMTVWSGAFLLAAGHGAGSWGASIYPAVMAAACFASEKSLANNERY